jgi:Tfp pilus assembly protein PilZ
MSLPTKRGYARNYLEAPIKFALTTSDRRHSGLMKNCSVGGMYFVTDVQLKPGAQIDIQIADTESRCTVPVNPSQLQSNVAWCESLDIERRKYGVGVRFRKSPKQRKRTLKQTRSPRKLGRVGKALRRST